jgi:L-alanine-DL-glutamate epimerase-like enolase superfamily enzyme
VRDSVSDLADEAELLEEGGFTAIKLRLGYRRSKRISPQCMPCTRVPPAAIVMTDYNQG